MPRLPSDAIERVKREILLRDVCAARGIELRSHGADLIGSCPFHDDRTPSFVVSAVKNLWHCLGKCQAGGSVIDLVMRLDGRNSNLQ